MNKNIEVTVIITTYKRPNFLERALKSVLNQTYKNIELIVIDDNNEGDEFRKETEKLLKKYDDKIIYIKNEKNIGASNSRNKALKFADGKYVAFLDDDDEYHDTFIEKLYKEIKESNLSLVYSQAMIKDGYGKLLTKTKSELFEYENSLEKHLLDGINSTSTILFNKKILKEIGGWVQIPCGQEDYLITRIFGKNYKGKSIPQELVNIYFHNQERISIGQQKIKGVEKLFELKKEYIKLLTKKSQNKVSYRNYISIAIANRDENLKKSLINYLKAIKLDVFNLKNISTLIVIILGINKYLIFKTKIKNILISK